MSEEEYPTDRYILYRYVVSVPAASIFVVLFTLTTAYHVYQLYRTKRWNMIPFIIGGLMSIGGYGARIKSHYDEWNLGAYIAQTLLLLVAPVLFAATIYMTLSGIIVTSVANNLAAAKASELSTASGSSNGEHSDTTTTPTTTANVTAADIQAARSTTVLKIPVVWITRIFVTADIVALCTQGGGGGIMAGGDPDNMELGENIVLAGLFVQIVAFSFFLFVAVVFDLRQRKTQTPAERAAKGWKNVKGWRRMLYALYAASALVLVRNIFRVIEYAQGNAGYLLRNEVWLYIFDAVLMFVLMVLVNVVHPGEVLVGDHYNLARHAEKERAVESRETDEMEMGQGQEWSKRN